MERTGEGESGRGRAVDRTGERWRESQGESDDENRRGGRAAGGERWSEQERDGESGRGRAMERTGERWGEWPGESDRGRE